MQSTEGSYEGHRVMLEAANEGANPSGGPLDRSFTVGNREIPMRSEYMRMQAAQDHWTEHLELEIEKYQ